MDLDETIKHSKEVADSYKDDCVCKQNYEQLYKWLTSYKTLKENWIILTNGILAEYDKDNTCRLIITKECAEEMRELGKILP